MRIIAGEHKGRRLVSPAGLDTRPTADRVKEALFSILQFELADADFLDLFAGSGQVGIEALSRGAARAVFVDAERLPCDCIRRNLEAVGLTDRAEVVLQDVNRYLLFCTEQFDIVFTDPPYRQGLTESLLESLSGIVRSGGVVVCEVAVGTDLPQQQGTLRMHRRYRYGKTELVLYRSGERQDAIY